MNRYNDRILLVIQKQAHNDLKNMAKKQGVSVNHIIRQAIFKEIYNSPEMPPELEKGDKND